MIKADEIKKSLKASAEDELKNNILAFWINNTIDMENGGFYGEIQNDLTVGKTSPKGSVLNARILWTFSSAYRITNDKKYLEIADRAYDYLVKYFWDKEYSGIYWMLDYKGNPLDTKKQIYAQAFAIYGLCEYYRVTNKKESLDRALELFNAIEKYSLDQENNGYFEAYTREWTLLEDLRLSEKDMNEKKSMNTHLHVLEAYTNLFRVCKEGNIKAALKNCLLVTIEHIVDSNSKHFVLFFDEKWTSKYNIISYGHDIEGSWLLYEAAEVLGDKEILEQVKKLAIEMAQVALDEGVDPKDNGLKNETHDNHEDLSKDWWPQAESVVGFYNAYELSLEDHFLKAAENSWKYILENISDHVNGEWFWGRGTDGKPFSDQPRVGFWKCPYHNSRVCMELMERIN